MVSELAGIFLQICRVSIDSGRQNKAAIIGACCCALRARCALGFSLMYGSNKSIQKLAKHALLLLLEREAWQSSSILLSPGVRRRSSTLHPVESSAFDGLYRFVLQIVNKQSTQRSIHWRIIFETIAFFLPKV